MSRQTWSRLTLRAALGLMVAAAPSCGPEGDDAPPMSVALATPQALQVECDNRPDDLQAELTITGNVNPCPLTVDLEAGTTTGTCPTSRGFVRTLTLDWFVLRTGPNGEAVRVVLAQARGELDFTGEAETPAMFAPAEPETATWSIGADDITVSSCVDVSEDQVNGSSTVEFQGASVPVCDLDDSCAAGTEPDCTNLGQLCATGAAF